MNQQDAARVLASGRCTFLTGPPGSGKTYVLRQFLEQARRRGRRVAVTATTGLAATHLGGTTVHSWSGLGTLDRVSPDAIRRMPAFRQTQIYGTDTLIIDEVSMLHAHQLDVLDTACKLIRDSRLPFGGIQVVVSGDLFQLPPVGSDPRWIVESRCWRDGDWAVCYLDEHHRQPLESELLAALTAMRAGRPGDAADILASSARPCLLPDSTSPTHLYATNRNVDRDNESRLDALPGPEVTFEMRVTGPERMTQQLVRSCLAPELLRLRTGARVIFLKNDPDGRFVNGSLGTVIGFDGFPVIETLRGTVVTAFPDTWDLRDGDLVRATLTQVPLKLAWALTVHKSQGMTLDAASVDLSDAFVDGIGYVGISRVRTLDYLELAGLSPYALGVSPAAVEFEQVILERSNDEPIPDEPAEAPAPPKPAAEPGFAQSSLFA